MLESLLLQELKIRVILGYWYRGIQLPPIEYRRVPASEKSDEIRGRKDQLFLVAAHKSLGRRCG